MTNLGSWVQKCDAQHDLHKHLTRGAMNMQPQLLMSLADSCVFSPSQPCGYVAMSYVWGKVPVTRAVTSNIARLMKLSALANPDVAVPNTIKDAMKLASLLGQN